MPEITVVIPVREGRNPYTTLASLAHQDEPFETVVSWDHGHGANWARNRGFALVRTPLVLFSDDDIRWESGALGLLRSTLECSPGASYAYGAYAIGDWVQCDREFSADRLRRGNYISTMSLIWAAHFPGFDEDVPRLQDWDLFLTMLGRGHVGVYCGGLIFRTEKGSGITYGPGGVSWEEANRMVRRKHKLGAA